jgi:hypothetical protein
LHTNLGTHMRARARTHTHTPQKPEETQVAISDTATYKPQHTKGQKYQYKTHTNTQWHTN